MALLDHAPARFRFLSCIFRPVVMKRKHAVAYQFYFALFFRLHKFVCLLSVAASVSELKVRDVCWVSTFGYWYDMIYCWRERVRILQAEVHRLTADATNSLGLKYLLAGFLICRPVSRQAVGPLHRRVLSIPHPYKKSGLAEP